MRTPRLWAVLAGLVIAVVPVHAAPGGFISTLSAEEQVASGIASLTEAEREALNELVAAEVALARQGGTAAFTGTFSSRRSPKARAASGIDRLSTDEVAELDRLVEERIMAGPLQRHAPKRFTDIVTKVRDRLEIHGEISFTYGWASGGRDFMGGTFSTVILDKETGTTFAFSYGQYEGDLFNFYDSRFYNSRNYASRFYDDLFDDDRYDSDALTVALDRERSYPRSMGTVRR